MKNQKICFKIRQLYALMRMFDKQFFEELSEEQAAVFLVMLDYAEDLEALALPDGDMSVEIRE